MLMRQDNVVTGMEPTFAELGIEPAAFSALFANHEHLHQRVPE
jgi:hypothetical protein